MRLAQSQITAIMYPYDYNADNADNIIKMGASDLSACAKMNCHLVEELGIEEQFTNHSGEVTKKLRGQVFRHAK